VISSNNWICTQRRKRKGYVHSRFLRSSTCDVC